MAGNRARDKVGPVDGAELVTCPAEGLFTVSSWIPSIFAISQFDFPAATN